MTEITYWHVCPQCGIAYSGLHICYVTPSTPYDAPYYRPPMAPPIGWICPKCGRGNAPWASTCPCVDKDPPSPSDKENT